MATPTPSPSTATAITNQLNRIRPKKPIDVWSTREKLCLASAVYKIGDQNWVSVSRAIKPYAEPNRPPDWFHQKNCVQQYYDMLEQLEHPKRKRGEKADTDAPSLQIMRKMTIERSEQLKKEVMEMQLEFKQMKAEADAIDDGEWDDQLEEEWEKIKAEQKIKEEDMKVEVMDTEQDYSMLKESGMVEGDESTQDSMGENVLGDDDGTASTSLVTSTPVASTSLDVTGKLPASSHLLSSLLQSDRKTTNELQQLKMSHEVADLNVIFMSSSVEKQQSKHQEQELENAHQIQSGQSQDLSISINKFSSASASGNSHNNLLLNAAKSTLLEGVGTVPEVATTTDVTTVDLEDSHVDVMTEVVEETVVEDMNNDDALLVTENVVIEESSDRAIPKLEDTEDSNSNLPVVEGVEEEVVGMTEEEEEEEEPDIKIEDDLEEVVVEEEPKDLSTELDVEGLDSIKEEPDKDSQDEDEMPLKQLSASMASGAEPELADSSLKIEPLSPTSSISSRISESGSKRGRNRGRPKTARSRMSSRKSYTDDERKDDGSTRFSDVELSDVDLRDADDLLSSTLGASATGSILSESFPNSPASLSICSDTEEEKSYKQWKKSIMLVWRAAATHKYANVFLHPVTDDIAPGYKSVVLRPMDLSTIKKNMESGAIRTTVEFQRDLMLMFSNAIMYNNSDHNVYRMATEMYDDVMRHIEQYVNTQIMVQTTDAKTHRQSRRADASDKEDDPKKRRLSVDQATEGGGKTKKRKTRLDESLP